MKTIILILILIFLTTAEDNSNYPRSIHAAVDSVLSSLDNQDKFLIKHTKHKKLGFFHFGLGTWIRNNFGLWGDNPTLLRECAAVKSTEQIHPDDASGIIIDSLWATLQKIDLKYQVPKSIIARSIFIHKDSLEEFTKLISYPELAWKSGTDSKYLVIIETDSINGIKNIDFNENENDMGFKHQTEEAIRNNWDEVKNILSLYSNRRIELELEFNTFGKKFEEYSK